MARNLAIIFVFLFVSLFTISAYSEIDLAPSDGSLGAKSLKGSQTLDSGNPSATMSDAGGEVTIDFDAASGGVNLTGVSGTTGVTYGIAKIYLDEGEAASAQSTENFRLITINNVSGEPTIVFPDGSSLQLPEGASIELNKLAGGSYYLKVLTGEVEYTDSTGNVRTLTSDSAAVYVKGFGPIPGWRNTREGWRQFNPDRNPATP